MTNNEQISDWLSAERRWDACKKWMHGQGKNISIPTMRRALVENGRTSRQRLAISLMQGYYNLCLSAEAQSSPPTYPHALQIATAPFGGG